LRHEQASRLQVGLWRCSLNPSLDFEGMLGLEASAAAVVRLGCCRERRFAFRIQSALQAQRRLSSGPLISAEESRTCSVVAKWAHERQQLSIGRFLLSLLPRSGNAGSCAQTDRQHRRVEALGFAPRFATSLRTLSALKLTTAGSNGCPCCPCSYRIPLNSWTYFVDTPA
jgi:hypothetical protein